MLQFVLCVMLSLVAFTVEALGVTSSHISSLYDGWTLGSQMSNLELHDSPCILYILELLHTVLKSLVLLTESVVMLSSYTSPLSICLKDSSSLLLLQLYNSF